MTWYWFALLSGLVLPWIVWGKAILAGFRDGGIGGGFGAWVAFSMYTIPPMFLIMWVINSLMG